MNVLLIEDDASGARSIELTLQWEGYRVFRTNLSRDMAELNRLGDFDIVLLNVDMETVGSCDGLKALSKIKSAAPRFVFWNSALSRQRFKELKGTQIQDAQYTSSGNGRNDEHPEDMFYKPQADSRSVISVGDLNIDFEKRIASITGQIIDLTPKEFELLALLSLRKGKIMPKEAIFNHLYNGIKTPQYKIIDVLICYLRKKLSVVGGDRYIETVWGRGYVLRDPKQDSKNAA